MNALLVKALLIGILYYCGAWVGVHWTSLQDGIAILWPPNAILLAAMFSSPPRHWPAFFLPVIIAEIAADVAVFSVLQAFLFALINISECLVAAMVFRGLNGKSFDLYPGR